MRIAMAEDVRFLTTANPSSILKLVEKATEFSDTLIQDIHDGTLSGKFHISAGIRAAVEPTLRANEPVLHVMRDGWYERQRREQVASGKRAFQAKTEVLSGIKADTQHIKPEVERIIDLTQPEAQTSGRA